VSDYAYGDPLAYVKAGRAGVCVSSTLGCLTSHPAHLFCVACQHGPEGQADLVDGEGRRPAAILAVIQDVQADVAVAAVTGQGRTGQDRAGQDRAVDSTQVVRGCERVRRWL
jgi:hypothetical protein